MYTEFKSTDLELSDLNKERRTAVIAHAVYDNIDRYGDISRKGMFSKSWQENKSIIFDIDHDRGQQPGRVVKTWEDEKKAYTQVSFGTHTLGNDTMIMMDEGIIRGASFEYIVEKKSSLNIKGRTIRELKEVRHLATTVTLASDPVNPEAGVVSVTKSQDKIKLLIDRLNQLELLCRESKASDETIEKILFEIKSTKSILDTASTQVATEPVASNELLRQLILFNMKL